MHSVVTCRCRGRCNEDCGQGIPRQVTAGKPLHNASCLPKVTVTILAHVNRVVQMHGLMQSLFFVSKLFGMLPACTLHAMRAVLGMPGSLVFKD